MLEVSRYLFIAGALPFLILGLAHARATPTDIGQSRGLSPRDPAVRQAMQSDAPVLTGNTSVWLAWVGFNFSHSLGAVLFGIVVVLVGRSPSAFAAEAAFFLPLALAVGGLYLLLAIRYWFRVPIMGTALSVACFLAACVLYWMSR